MTQDIKNLLAEIEEQEDIQKEEELDKWEDNPVEKWENDEL